jgi:hypothetical protein
VAGGSSTTLSLGNLKLDFAKKKEDIIDDVFASQEAQALKKLLWR